VSTEFEDEVLSDAHSTQFVNLQSIVKIKAQFRLGTGNLK
jgi:hypothetical protein